MDQDDLRPIYKLFEIQNGADLSLEQRKQIAAVAIEKFYANPTEVLDALQAADEVYREYQAQIAAQIAAPQRAIMQDFENIEATPQEPSQQNHADPQAQQSGKSCSGSSSSYSYSSSSSYYSSSGSEAGQKSAPNPNCPMDEAAATPEPYSTSDTAHSQPMYEEEIADTTARISNILDPNQQAYHPKPQVAPQTAPSVNTGRRASQSIPQYSEGVNTGKVQKPAPGVNTGKRASQTIPQYSPGANTGKKPGEIIVEQQPVVIEQQQGGVATAPRVPNPHHVDPMIQQGVDAVNNQVQSTTNAAAQAAQQQVNKAARTANQVQHGVNATAQGINQASNGVANMANGIASILSIFQK